MNHSPFLWEQALLSIKRTELWCMLIVVSLHFSASSLSFPFLPTLQTASTEICNSETVLDSSTAALLNHTFDGKRQSKRSVQL